MTALHVNYGLRDDADEDERHCAELCERLGVELEVERPRRPEGARQPAGLGARQRYAAAARAGGGRRRRRSSPATPPTTRSRRSSTGSPPRPAAAPCSGCGRATAASPGRCSASPGRRPPPTARSAACAWREDASNEEPAYARNRVRHGLLPELERIHPAAARERAAHGGAAARRGRGARRAGRRRARRLRRRAPAGTIALERLAELPPALRRLVLQRLADGAAGRPVPGAARFAEQVAGLRRSGIARSTSAAASAPWSRAASCAPSGTGRERAPYGTSQPDRHISRLRRVSDPAIGETLVAREDLQAPGRRAGRGGQPRLRRPRAGHGRGAEGRRALPRRPDAPHRRALRDRLHGGLQLRLPDRLLRRRPHPQGPRRPDRRPRRADRRGHHRLRPHPALPDAQPATPATPPRSRSARC